LGKKRSCALTKSKTQEEVDDWIRDGAFWEAFGKGASKVLGLKSYRYSQIEENVDRLLEKAKKEFFWADGTPKTFSERGGLLGKGEEGHVIVYSLESIENRFRKFRKRAILTGKVENLSVPEHVAVVGKSKHGMPCFEMPCLKAILHSGDVEGRNGLQQGWTESASGVWT
jgi:hypothetical protein